MTQIKEDKVLFGEQVRILRKVFVINQEFTNIIYI